MYKLRAVLIIFLMLSTSFLLIPNIIMPVYAAPLVGGTLQIKEHRYVVLPGANDPTVLVTQTNASGGYIEMDDGPTAPPIAEMTIFVVFEAARMNNKNITIEFQNGWGGAPGQPFDIRILDGSYLRSNATQFPDQAITLLEGNGVLQTGYSSSVKHTSWTNVSFISSINATFTYVTLVIRQFDTHATASPFVLLNDIWIRDIGGIMQYSNNMNCALNMEVLGTDNDYGYCGVDSGDPPIGALEASIDSFSVTNLEPCSKYVYVDEKYYTFALVVGGGNISDTVWLQFTDGLTNATFRYDNIIGSSGHLEGRNITTLGSITTSLNTGTNQLTVNFHILFRMFAIDALDVDVQGRANDTTGFDTGWVNIAPNEFNIYNIGGLVQTVTTGTAGRIDGGDTFELQAANLTSAFANQTFRRIQQFRAQFGLRLSDQAGGTGFVIGFQDFAGSGGGAELYMDKGDWTVEIAMNYCDVEDDVMVKGFYVIFMMENGDLGNNDLWTGINATWYDRDDTKIRSDIFTAWPETQEARIRFWIDLWYNKINASSTGGGRLNAYYTGMDTTAFLLWQGGWSPMITNASDSMAFIPLLNNASESITSPELDLMSVSVNLTRPANSPGTGGINVTATLLDWQQLDMKFGLNRMVGIDTPTPVETKVPDMPITGFFAPLIAAVLSIGSWVASGMGALAALAWAALDSQFPFLTQGILGIYELLTGFGNFFVSLTSNLTQLLVFLAEQLWLITIFTDMIVDSFGFIMGWVDPFLSQADSWIILFLVVFIIIPFAGMAAAGDLKGMESDIRKLGGILNTMLEWSIRLIQIAIQFIVGLKPF